MKKTIRILSATALILLSLSSVRAQTATWKMVSAANSFLATLDDKQKKSVLLACADERRRKRWSNFPISMAPREGLSMGEMNPAQRAAAVSLVSSALSPRRFGKVEQIMDADQVLKTTEGGQQGGRGRGGPQPTPTSASPE